MRFAFEAMRPDGTTVADFLEADSHGTAAENLRDKGLMVLRIDESAAGEHVHAKSGLHFHGSRVTNRDLILFTRQMKMLLEAGAPLVPALEAAQEQTAKPVVHEVLGRVREAVEEGASLSGALDDESEHFDPVFRTMIAAGEATAALPEVFGRLGDLAQQQQRTRKMIIGALIYPIVLSVLLVGVMALLLFFVVPRFSVLFTSLNSELPATTELLFTASKFLKTGWPYVLGGIVAAITGMVVCWRLPETRAWIDHVVLGLPAVGPLVSRLILARVVRVWAAMLRCHVPLLESIQQSREAVSNAAFLDLIKQVEDSVSSGGRMAEAVGATHLADPIIVSALRTGEDNGRLSESVDFVSTWLDEDNTNAVHSVTKLAEPLLLAVMGVVVGFVAMSLFLPLFDLATAA